MLTYGFRVRFKLPSDNVIRENLEEVELLRLLDGKPLTLKAISATRIADAHNLSVRASGFGSEQEAFMYGQRTKNALMICGARRRIGIDVGKDQATSGAGKIVREHAKEAGILLLNDVHGLSVFPEELPVRFASLSARAVIEESTERFVQDFRQAFEFAPDLSNKQMLALELYAASKFEVSLKARFLTLVSAVEALVVREREAPEVVEHVNRLIKTTKATLEGEVKESMVSRLGDLKVKSISTSCEELVKRYLGAEKSKLFASAYDIRSKILHEGDVPAGTDLGSHYSRLDQLVSELLGVICAAYDVDGGACREWKSAS